MTDKLTEAVAQLHVDCGDGSTMGLRFIVALGLIEQSKMDDMQDKLNRVDAMAASYKAIRAAILETLRQIREPSDEMKAAGRAALREGGLLPAYTDEGENGQPPIMQTLLDPTFEAMIDQKIAEIGDD